MTIGRNLAGSVGSYLPEMITEMWEPARDFAFLKLPSGGVRSLVAVNRYDICLNLNNKEVIADGQLTVIYRKSW